MKRHLLILFLALMAISADLVSGHDATYSSCDRIPRGSRRFYGRSPNMPGKSCMDILNKNLSIRNNGIYWIKLNGKESHIAEWDLEETKAGGPFKEILNYDIFVNDIFLLSKIPPFLTKDMLDTDDRKLTMVVDVSCDIGNPNNPVPFIENATTPTKPVDVLPLSIAGVEVLAPGITWEKAAPKDAIILGLKNLPYDDTSPISQHHVFFAHAYKDQPGAKEVIGRFTRGGGAILDIEYMLNEEGVAEVYPTIIVLGALGRCGWTMVLKLVSGSGEDVADLWEAPFAIREFDQRLLHLMPVHNWPYKNKIVRQWNVFKPEEARVVLYKRGAKVLTVGFNAIDSNKMNWFSSSRLVDSPWSDLGKEPKNFFTIKGDTANNRHFLINRSYGGCPMDFGWLVTGQLWHCKWEQGYKKAAFLYSKIGTHTNWNKHENVGSADVFTVFVR
ncbi:predicted protein [Nematostella vectensis]|uniref:Uncharacterized protein n=1 Tax=Nematostella vectensis TaxID=45351 RepID=A7S2W7_NEMVE|nr:predicted protein [Nematostella vectensis]|eukprot:XP_001634024.1 predicted protein [Nematostella vectensis]